MIPQTGYVPRCMCILVSIKEHASMLEKVADLMTETKLRRLF